MGFGELHGWPRWRRIVIGAYWLGVMAVAVGGWQTRLVRVRRIRLAIEKGSMAGAVAPSTASAGPTSKVGVEAAREEKRRHVSLDLRRKFFHALAVLMFVPGIALDVRSSARSVELTLS